MDLMQGFMEYVWFFLFMASFFLILFLIKNHSNLFSNFFVAEGKLVNDLKLKVNELEKRVEALNTTIQILIDRIASINKVGGVSSLQAAAAVVATPSVGRPVLLVYGDERFGEADRNALRRAGVGFFRLTSASLEELRTELQRRRSDGRMYDVVHISAHGGGGNLLLEGALTSGIQLSDVLNGVRVVFLGTCSNQLVADKLVGVAKYVIVVYEEISEHDAAEFTYEFYKRYKENTQDIDGAFIATLTVMPHISDYVDLRKGG